MYRVLLAEDEFLIQAGIQASVPWDQLDMQVIARCSDGAAAWKVCQNEMPDIVITDLRMPLMDGLDLIRNIRQHDLRCRIIIITCVEDFFIVKDILDKDVTAYLLKATMTTEDILSTLKKAKAHLDNLRSNAAPFQSAQHSFSDLLRDYVLERTITHCEFSHRASNLYGTNEKFGAMMLLRFPHYIAVSEVRNLLSNRLSILGNCVLLDAPNGLFVLISQPVESAMLRSCFSGISSALLAELGLEIHAAVCSEELSFKALPDIYRECSNILEFPYFYPASYYDLAASDATNPSIERDSVLQFSQHPICKGLIRIGSERLQTAFQELKSSYGTDTEAFVRALCASADVLSLHLTIPDSLLNEIETAPHASAGAALLCSQLPACDRHCLYAREIDSSVEYLCSNFTECAVKLSDLADRCNFSVGYFSLLFRKSVGLSFTEYLTILRIEKARQLLETTKMSVQQVSNSCGFTAVSYFTRYFGQKAHCSPKEWRKRHCTK